jgi:hypothetical protein
MTPRPERSGSHTGQVQSYNPGQDQADRHEFDAGHRVTEKDHPHGGRPGSFRNTANPVSNNPAVTSNNHAIAVTSPFVRVMCC